MPSYFILVPILLPVIAGILLLVFPIEDARKRNICIEIIVVINTLLVLWLLTHRPSESFYMFSLGARLPLTLNVDGLAMFFAGLVACLWPLASLYAFEYMKHEERVNTFMAFYTITYEMCIRDRSYACCGNGRLSRNYDGYSGNDGYLWFFLCLPEAFDSADCFLVCVAGVQSSARKT